MSFKGSFHKQIFIWDGIWCKIYFVMILFLTFRSPQMFYTCYGSNITDMSIAEFHSNNVIGTRLSDKIIYSTNLNYAGKIHQWNVLSPMSPTYSRTQEKSVSYILHTFLALFRKTKYKFIQCAVLMHMYVFSHAIQKIIWNWFNIHDQILQMMNATEPSYNSPAEAWTPIIVWHQDGRHAIFIMI